MRPRAGLAPLWDALGTLWDALGHLGSFRDALASSGDALETLWDSGSLWGHLRMVWGDGGGGGLLFLIYANSRSTAYAAVMLS